MNDTIEKPQETLPAPEVWEYDIPAYRREVFDHKIDLANRRLERAGVKDRFRPSYVAYERTEVKGGIELPDGTMLGGVKVTQPFLHITLDVFTLSLGHYVFVAALVAEEAGYTVHSAPGQNLDGWTRPPVDDVHCDHCGVKRNRNRLYIIRDEDTGQLLQVGHSCIEMYTGLSPKGLWALQYDAELKSLADEDSGGGSGGSDYGVPINDVLGMSFAFSDRGRSYVSRNAAGYGAGEATGSLVRSWLFFPPPRPSGRWATPQIIAQWEAERDMAIQGRMHAADESLMADIKAVAQTLKPGTDYADNMSVILAGEHVSGRNVGILASLVSVYAREKELAVARARAPKVAKGFLAPVKTRVKERTKVTLRTVRIWEGDFGFTTLMVGYTEDMHCVVWKASGRYDVEVGDTLVLSAYTVKAHEVYGEEHPIDQTVITRAVVKDTIK